MSDLTLEIVADVVAACTAGTGEAAEAISRTLDAEITLAVGEPATFDPASPPKGFDGPGLVVLLKFGDASLAVALSEETGLLPSWYAAPDATGESKLSTLAQELGMLFVPETMMADDFCAARVANLSKALSAGKPAEGAALVPIEASAGDKQGTLQVIWPFADQEAIKALYARDESAVEEAGTSNEETSSTGAANGPTASPSSVQPVSDGAPTSQNVGDGFPRFAGEFGEGLQSLPAYTRSLLRIEIPVIVKLADKKQSIQEIIDLGPGSIISFDKSCDEMLDMQIGDLTIARGEAVKVGDKFGLRIHSMVLPEERFNKVAPHSSRVG